MPLNPAAILSTLTSLPDLLRTGQQLYAQFRDNLDQFSEGDQEKIETAWRDVEAERERLHAANQRIARGG